MGDATSRFRTVFDILLFYVHEVQSLTLSTESALLRRNHIMGVIRKFRNENGPIYDELVKIFEDVDSEITTGDDVYETAAAALWLMLDDIDVLDDVCKNDDCSFVKMVADFCKRVDVVQENGIPQRIVLKRGHTCSISRLE
jgi:hypothetical protein